jgi:hypothetical protein
MKYNINIFKTPSYQKIFKEVLKLRHPNLSEEEALKEEVKYLGCLFYSKRNQKQKDCLFHLIRCDENVCWFFDKKEEEPLNKDNKYICVGRPITISELVDVLNSKQNYEKEVWYNYEKEVWYYAGGSIVMMDEFKKENGGWELQECMRLVEGELENINFLHELEEYTLNEVVDELD